MNYKRALTLSLTAALSIGLLAGCGGERTPAPEPTAPTVSPSAGQDPAELPTSFPTETPVPSGATEQDPLGFEAQIAALVAARDVWRMEEEDWGELSWYAYTVCDLDLNGRLELLGTTTQGTGMFTTNYMWEVNEAGDGVELRSDPEVPTTLGTSGTDPETGEKLPYPAYYDRADGILYVEYADVVRNGAAGVYESREVLYLRDGKLQNRPLAFRLALYDADGNETLTFEAADGSPITPEDYENAGALAFPDTEPQGVYLEWLIKERTADMSDEALTEALTRCGEGFVFGAELPETGSH